MTCFSAVLNLRILSLLVVNWCVCLRSSILLLWLLLLRLGCLLLLWCVVLRCSLNGCLNRGLNYLRCLLILRILLTWLRDLGSWGLGVLLTLDRVSVKKLLLLRCCWGLLWNILWLWLVCRLINILWSTGLRRS